MENMTLKNCDMWELILWKYKYDRPMETSPRPRAKTDLCIVPGAAPLSPEPVQVHAHLMIQWFLSFINLQRYIHVGLWVEAHLFSLIFVNVFWKCIITFMYLVTFSRDIWWSSNWLLVFACWGVENNKILVTILLSIILYFTNFRLSYVLACVC